LVLNNSLFNRFQSFRNLNFAPFELRLPHNILNKFKNQCKVIESLLHSHGNVNVYFKCHFKNKKKFFQPYGKLFTMQLKQISICTRSFRGGSLAVSWFNNLRALSLHSLNLSCTEEVDSFLSFYTPIFKT